MNQSYFYLSHDPVNEHCLRRWVEERGGTLCPLSLRDAPPDGEQITSRETRPPRQWQDTIPKESSDSIHAGDEWGGAWV
jgi:hypothetical protein